MAEFYKSDIVETDEIETSTDFLNFADMNFKLIALKFRTILFQKKRRFSEGQGFHYIKMLENRPEDALGLLVLTVYSV